jgi:hypothetical protein
MCQVIELDTCPRCQGMNDVLHTQTECDAVLACPWPDFEPEPPCDTPAVEEAPVTDPPEVECDDTPEAVLDRYDINVVAKIIQEAQDPMIAATRLYQDGWLQPVRR